MRRVKLWKFGGLNLLGRAQLAAGMKMEEMEVEQIDFAYVDVPTDLKPHLEKIDPHSGNILESRQCTIWPAVAIAEPVAGARYGFAGHTKPSLEDQSLIAPDLKFCFTELRVCFPMSFVGERDDMLCFQLPVEHPGHEFFKGCSGAPIIDENGHVVALVCGGIIDESIIYGVSMRRRQFALDIHTGRFG